MIKNRGDDAQTAPAGGIPASGELFDFRLQQWNSTSWVPWLIIRHIGPAICCHLIFAKYSMMNQDTW